MARIVVVYPKPPEFSGDYIVIDFIRLTIQNALPDVKMVKQLVQNNPQTKQGIIDALIHITERQITIRNDLPSLLDSIKRTEAIYRGKNVHEFIMVMPLQADKASLANKILKQFESTKITETTIDTYEPVSLCVTNYDLILSGERPLVNLIDPALPIDATVKNLVKLLNASEVTQIPFKASLDSEAVNLECSEVDKRLAQCRPNFKWLNDVIIMQGVFNAWQNILNANPAVKIKLEQLEKNDVLLSEKLHSFLKNPPNNVAICAQDLSSVGYTVCSTQPIIAGDIVAISTGLMLSANHFKLKNSGKETRYSTKICVPHPLFEAQQHKSGYKPASNFCIDAESFGGMSSLFPHLPEKDEVDNDQRYSAEQKQHVLLANLVRREIFYNLFFHVVYLAKCNIPANTILGSTYAQGYEYWKILGEEPLYFDDRTGRVMQPNVPIHKAAASGNSASQFFQSPDMEKLSKLASQAAVEEGKGDFKKAASIWENVYLLSLKNKCEVDQVLDCVWNAAQAHLKSGNNERAANYFKLVISNLQIKYSKTLTAIESDAKYALAKEMIDKHLTTAGQLKP